MNISKRDVQELRRRMKKKECSITRIRGCYVNSGKQVVVQFSQPFSELEGEEFLTYLEIAKKTFSGSLGGNLLELEFDRTEAAIAQQKFLLSLRADKLQTDDLANRYFEQVVKRFEYPGNYLALLYHDAYDVIKRSSDDAELDESEEIYEYLIGAVCPVDLSKAELGYREEENRIGARERDWIVGPPDLGFVYPAFINRSSDVNAVLYYVRTGRESHAELIQNVLGCVPQRTAAEERMVFHHIVQDAFGEDKETANAAFLRIQKNLSELAAEQSDYEDAPPEPLTAETVAELVTEDFIPEASREQIAKAYAREFGESPTTAGRLLDSKLAAEGVRQAHVAHLEQQVAGLKAQLSEQTPPSDGTEDDTPPWEETPKAAIRLEVSNDKAARIRTETLDGQRCLLIPLEENETALINGETAKL